MATKKRSKSRPVSQAALQTLTRFRPQFDALTELAYDAKATRDSSIKSANTVAAAVRASLEQARQPLADIYDTQIGRQGETNAGLKADLSGLAGPAAEAIRAAAIADAARTTSGLGAARTAGLQGLTDQAGRAGAGQQQAVLQASTKFADDITKIGRQKTSLSAQMGDYEASTQADLDAEARKQAHADTQSQLDRDDAWNRAVLSADTSTANAQRSAAVSEANNRRTNAAKEKGALPGGVPLRNQKDHETLQTEITKARSWAADLLAVKRESGDKAAGFDKPFKELSKQQQRRIVGKLLIRGDKDAKIPAFSQAAASTALDEAMDGRVSLGTVRNYLHTNGYSAKQLRLKVRGRK